MLIMFIIIYSLKIKIIICFFNSFVGICINKDKSRNFNIWTRRRTRPAANSTKHFKLKTFSFGFY